MLVITPVLSVRTHQAYKRTAQHRNQNLVKMAASDAFPLHSYPRDSSFPLNTLAKIFLQAGDENQGSCQFHLCFLRCAKICCKAKFFVFFFLLATRISSFKVETAKRTLKITFVHTENRNESRSLCSWPTQFSFCESFSGVHRNCSTAQ